MWAGAGIEDGRSRLRHAKDGGQDWGLGIGDGDGPMMAASTAAVAALGTLALLALRRATLDIRLWSAVAPSVCSDSSVLERPELESDNIFASSSFSALCRNPLVGGRYKSRRKFVVEEHSEKC